MICPEMSARVQDKGGKGVLFVDCQEGKCPKWRPPVGKGAGACAITALSEDMESLLELAQGVVAGFLAHQSSARTKEEK